MERQPPVLLVPYSGQYLPVVVGGIVGCLLMAGGVAAVEVMVVVGGMGTGVEYVVEMVGKEVCGCEGIDEAARGVFYAYWRCMCVEWAIGVVDNVCFG